MNQQNKITTISEFLLHAGTEYIVLDVSRGRHVLDNQYFFDIENNKDVFPRPRQNNAWLCIMFWNKNESAEHYIWYLKLPIDERGLLQAAARDQFLQILIEALGTQMQLNDSVEAGLPENPFVFTPSQQMRADCNAKFKSILNMELNEEAKLAQRYLSTPSVIDWQTLSVQNFADALAFIKHEDLSQALKDNLYQYPQPVLNCLFAGLEGMELSETDTDLIATFVKSAKDITKALGLRAISLGNMDIRKKTITTLLENSSDLDVELLVVIAGRHWQCLENIKLLSLYMQRVAEVTSEQKFIRRYLYRPGVGSCIETIDVAVTANN